jgi:hypothetical protein
MFAQYLTLPANSLRSYFRWSDSAIILVIDTYGIMQRGIAFAGLAVHVRTGLKDRPDDGHGAAVARA